MITNCDPAFKEKCRDLWWGRIRRPGLLSGEIRRGFPEEVITSFCPGGNPGACEDTNVLEWNQLPASLLSEKQDGIVVKCWIYLLCDFGPVTSPL